MFEDEKIIDQLLLNLKKFDEHTLRCFSLMALNTKGYFQYFNYDDYYRYDRNDTREMTNQILLEFRHLDELGKQGLKQVKETQLLLYRAVQDCNDDEIVGTKYNVAGFLTDKVKCVSFDEYLFYINCLNNLCWDENEQGVTVLKLIKFSKLCSSLVHTRETEDLQKEKELLMFIKEKTLKQNYVKKIK